MHAPMRMAAIVKPERQLRAGQVVAYRRASSTGLGTVNARGEPRVAPLDGHFVHRRFTLSRGIGALAEPRRTRLAVPPTMSATT